MKAPSWMELRFVGEHGPACGPEPHAHLTLRVKRWHPGYWLFFLRVKLGLEKPE